MEFGELPPQMMDAFMRILNNHLEVAQVNLENEKVLFPILAFINATSTRDRSFHCNPP